MSDKIKCFWLEDLRRCRYTLRVYQSSDKSKCSGRYGYHNAHSEVIAENDEISDEYIGTNPPKVEKSDPRWPVKCGYCDHQFSEDDNRQVFADAVYKRQDTGESVTLDTAPAGAMWNASWWPGKNTDGNCLMLKLPDGVDWMIDGKANNCSCNGTDPKHFCWQRTGTVPNVTASPSIATPGYHGWLRDGWLVKC